MVVIRSTRAISTNLPTKIQATLIFMELMYKPGSKRFWQQAGTWRPSFHKGRNEKMLQAVPREVLSPIGELPPGSSDGSGSPDGPEQARFHSLPVPALGSGCRRSYLRSGSADPRANPK